MPLTNYIDTTRRVDSNTETLQDIEQSYHLNRSLFILLSDQMLSDADIQTLVHKYTNLHSMCARSIRQLEHDLYNLDSIHLLDVCIAVKIRVDNVIHMLQIGRPRDTDTALQAAQWEVRIQQSMLTSRRMHGNFLDHHFASF